jgi:hypothetical protein
MGSPHTATRPPVPVYRVDLALIARLHAAHAASAAHQQAQAAYAAWRPSYDERIARWIPQKTRRAA